METGARNRDQVRQRAGLDARLVERLPAGSYGQARGLLGVAVQPLAGRRAPVIDAATGQKYRLRIPCSLDHVADHVRTVSEVPAVDASLPVQHAHQGRLLRIEAEDLRDLDGRIPLEAMRR